MRSLKRDRPPTFTGPSPRMLGDHLAIVRGSISFRDSGPGRFTWRNASSPVDTTDDTPVGTGPRAHHRSYDHLNAFAFPAGTGRPDEFGNHPLRWPDNRFTVNVSAPFLITQLLLPVFRAAVFPSADAKVEVLALLAGGASSQGFAADGASKAALVSRCKSISAGDVSNGVPATAICLTRLGQHRHGELGPRSTVLEVMMQPDDITGPVLVLGRLSRNDLMTSIVVTAPGVSLWRP